MALRELTLNKMMHFLLYSCHVSRLIGKTMTRQHSTACFISSGILSAANPKLHHLLQSLHSSPSLTCSPSHSVPPLFLLPFPLPLSLPPIVASATLWRHCILHTVAARSPARPECFCSSDTRNYQSRIMKSVAEAAAAAAAAAFLGRSRLI